MSDLKYWDILAANNDDTTPDGAPEGMLPSDVNNCIREVMASVRREREHAEWMDFNDTITYTGTTTFTVVGDLTSQYTVNRRIKAVGTLTGTIYGYIVTSVYTSLTTVTVFWDSGTLNNEALAISVGILDPANSSVPGQSGLVGVQVFDTAGTSTWTKGAGTTKVKVIIQGGGGGGGGTPTTPTTNASGGGGGGYSEELIDVTAITSETVTVGAGGAGAYNTSTGTTGGTSSFGSHCSATGGIGGVYTAGAVAGGTGAGGDINIAGGQGRNQLAGNQQGGGDSQLGSGGMNGASTIGANGQSYGAGGGAPYNVGPSTGGDGADGIVIVWEYK